MSNKSGSRKTYPGNVPSSLEFRTIMNSDNVFFDDPKVKIERVPSDIADKYFVKVSYEPVWVTTQGDFCSTGVMQDTHDITRQVNQIQMIFKIIERDSTTYKTGVEAYAAHSNTLLKIGNELNDIFGVWLLYAASKIIYSKNKNHYNLLCEAWSPISHW
jgi:hypothetical protein